MSPEPKLIRVALPVPLADTFDYLWPEGEPPAPGSRVRVPFGRSERVGVVLERPATTAVAPDRLKAARVALDRSPLLGAELLATLCWAADYYQHPIGEVLAHALPPRLRAGAPLPSAFEDGWRLTPAGAAENPAALERRAPQQAALLRLVSAHEAVRAAELRAAGIANATLRRGETKGWIERVEVRIDAPQPRARPADDRPALTADQQRVLATIEASADGFASFLLFGVTGAGKTEVYLRLVERELGLGRQTLLLVPEIALTPQLVARLRARFGATLAVLHSGLAASAREQAWQRAHAGDALLVVGTRSAVFSPLPNAGLVIVDEEHDSSYKQHTGFKYSARDLAVMRARRLGIKVVLASATPSLESVYNAELGRYTLLSMPKRIGAGGMPRIGIIDMNRQAPQQGLSVPLLEAIDRHLAADNQVLLYLNRRGFAPVLLCPQCQKAEECSHCDARMTVHAGSGELRCHHCGAHRSLAWSCQSCGSERIAVGAGTQRVTDRLKALYPELKIARLDRDVTARRGALDQVLEDVQQGRTRILVGTQMLTKGHDFPRVTLVGILNADQGLFGTDFRSEERLAQTLLQVAGRAGRRDDPGEVLIQTHCPGHPILASLQRHDYAAFATRALAERRAAGWPPYTYLAVWRAESVEREIAHEFLARVRTLAQPHAHDVRVLGPAPASMEKREGRYRAQLLFESTRREALRVLLARTLVAVRARNDRRRVRWSIDVDPLET